ncbi:MAG TPA: hypothetical protein VHW23_24705 [Kofleriaceae bacterium]|nr:hypothetical protein [Kofleriaceae bacterium]
MLRACVAAVVAAAVGAVAAPAHAYEFWLRTQAIGQAYQLRDYRLIGPDLVLGRMRFTDTLALRIWDVGDLSLARRQARLPDRGLRISWQSYLRIDHDFGDFTSGSVVLPGTPGMPAVRRDAIDVTPELAESVASLELLYGYLELAGLYDDRLTVRLGRVLADDGWGTTAVDGGDARFEVPSLPIAVSASAGLRVRASSPLGLSAYELDGTSGAACQEYVEGPTPGTGTWQLIDRGRMITNHALSSDYEYCPQREVNQPTVGVTIATTRVAGFGAEVGYRRTWSDTVGLIGPVDRFMYPDRGLYPNEVGQAPATGIDEERLWGRVHGELRAAGLAIAPYADLRYSLLHAAVDRADAGVRLSRGDDTLEPSVEYFYPTFDGDSIFNAFSIEPTTDLRLGYQHVGGWPIRASAWLRAYHHEAGDASYAGGGDAGVERSFGASWRARASALWDGGYGGRRAGATAEATWRVTPGMWLRGSTALLGVASDEPGQPRYATSSTQLSSTWRLSDGVALHTIVEADHDAIRDFQYRVTGVFDFAFFPEP